MFEKFRKVILLAVFLCFWAVNTTAQGEKTEITIGILPCSDEVMTFKKFYPLITYLKQQTGLAVKIVVPKDFNKLESAVRKGEIDFVLQDPHTYIKLAALFNRTTLLKALDRKGVNSQHAVIIVRQDSGIKELDDLRGKTMMFGPKLSLTKWIAAKELLQEKGIDIDKDLKAYSNGGCCEDIAFNVYLKTVDAGVICDHYFGGHAYEQKELGIDTRTLVIIGKTREFPMRMFAARKGLSDDIVNQVIQALLKLDRENPEHAEILHLAEFGGFEKSSDREYDGIRTLIGNER